MMNLAYRVFIVTLTLFALVLTSTAQTSTDKSKRSEKDTRNTAPTVGTGGPVGGPTGLFTVYDGQTLRRGEYTFSAAISNYDRDPGNVDITELPVSFQVGLSNNFELFFNTDAYRGVKVNNPELLSSFYLPNSRIRGVSPAAIVSAPLGWGTSFAGAPAFRPAGAQGFSQFPFTGIGLGSGNSTSVFPGVGSVYGSILPGIVLQTVSVTPPGGVATLTPSVYTTAPTYLPDAPFINRTWATSAFNTYTVGGKWRFTDVNNPVGFGVIGAYRWYQDDNFYNDGADTLSGFNQLQRGASPGGDRGDFLVTLFADARLARWANVSGNVGYHLNSSVKSTMGGSSEYTLLDRPDELLMSAALDFPVNKYFQPILEFRSLRYMGGRTPNALEKHPMDAIAGFRVYPTRWFGLGFAYRYNVNQEDGEDFESFNGSSVVICPDGQTPDGKGCSPFLASNSFTGRPPGFRTSENPHGYIFQTWIGRRNKRLEDKVNQWANVTALNLSNTTIKLPCPAGTRSENTCDDSTTINVSTTAVDPENDVLTYNYTVSGGRIVGEGANVQWDLSGLGKGSYTITAGVNDGCGLCGETKTQTVTIEDCEGCKELCDCGTLSVTGPAGLTEPGDAMTFTANVSGGSATPTYNWTVSGGTIESGQGTASIRVRTSADDAGKNITATVSLGGLDPNCNCQTEASDTGSITTHPDPVLIDEYGKLKADDVRARLDAFFLELQNNPTNQGYVINYGTDREIAAAEKLINNHITFRRFDRSRITLVRGGNTGETKTKLYRIPPGAENPAP